MKTKTTIPLQKNGDVYSKTSDGVFYSPFNLSIDPMEQLMLVNFEKDTDVLYNTLEIQQASNKNGQKKLLVIAYRNDGAADVYHQPEYPFASQDSVLNNATFFERPLENAKFEIKTDNIEVYVFFEDRRERKITVRVNESNIQRKKPFFLLAPVGVISLKPASLPVYSLYEMSFTKQKTTSIEIEIDKVKHKPDTFPIPIDCSKNFFTRYSIDTFNVDWNKNFNGELTPLTPDSFNKTEASGITYELEEQNGHYEIKRMRANNRKHSICIEYNPAIPDIACLKQETDINGNFSITTDNTESIIQGYYHIKKRKNEIDMKIRPDKGWKPNENRWIIKFLFLFVKVFREWPKSYVWNARIRFDNNAGLPTIQSGWERI